MDRLNIPQTAEELQRRIDAIRAKGDSQPLGVPYHPLHTGGRADCDVCDGTGWKVVEVDGVRRNRWCDCAKPQDDAEGVPYEFHGVTLESYEDRDGQALAVKRAREFAIGSVKDLYLTGGVGAGKSRLAAAIANSAHRARKTVSFQRVPFLLHQLQPGRDNVQLEERLLTVAILVLDDLGAERDQATDYTRRTLLMIYEARCDTNRRTVFTSNKSLQELAEMQDDDRLTSRIAGRCEVVKVTTPDQRLRRVK